MRLIEVEFYMRGVYRSIYLMFKFTRFVNGAFIIGIICHNICTQKRVIFSD